MRSWLLGSGFAGFALAVLSSPIPAAASDYTVIPDPQFEQVLIDKGIDSEGTLDGQILTTDIASASTIAGEEAGIMDLTGIEDARSLKTLLLFGNDLATLDLSNNLVLATLEAGANQLQGILDLSGKPDLISVDVTNNPNLICVQVHDPMAANAGTGQYQGWSIDRTTVYSQDCSAVMAADGSPHPQSHVDQFRKQCLEGTANPPLCECAVMALNSKVPAGKTAMTYNEQRKEEVLVVEEEYLDSLGEEVAICERKHQQR